jgi:hypothetical protein
MDIINVKIKKAKSGSARLATHTAPTRVREGELEGCFCPYLFDLITLIPSSNNWEEHVRRRRILGGFPLN